ncbi:armadillo-type protein [Chlamydoabsidia padenii]|nr:armadillo-type protein [Chlamydoabsidia padenii]
MLRLNKQQQQQQQQYHLGGPNNLTLSQQQIYIINAVARYHLGGPENGNDIVTLMGNDSQQKSTTAIDEVSENDLYADQPHMLVESNRLLEEPEEGYNTNSLLQAILTEEGNEGDLDESVLIDMDESLSSVERVYKYSKSNVMFHRHLVAKELPIALYEVDINEAVTEILPVVLKIAYDKDETVRETFVSELDKIIMYYYQNAPPSMDTSQTHGSPSPSKSSSSSSLSSSSSVPNNSLSETDDISTTENQQDPAKDERHDKNKTDDHHEQTTLQHQPYSATPETLEKQQSDNKSVSHLEQQRRQSTSTNNKDATSQHHIPAKKFAPLLILILLDQNSNLASLGQQCIVSIATELASTSPDSERAVLDRYLLDTEIFDGVILGLMDIVHGRTNHTQEEQQHENSDKKYKDDDDSLSANLSATSINKDSPSSGTSIIRRPSATPGFEPSSQTTDDSSQGEINLAKMTCLSLISALTVVLGSEWAIGCCLPIVEQLASDPMFYVRREAAGAIGSLATVVDVDTALNRLLPLYLEFSRDTIWHVRRSCVLTLPLLCGVLPDETKIKIATEGVEIFKNDVSRIVRNTLVEVIGELIAKFLPEDWETSGRPGKVPDTLLEFFLSLGSSGNSNQMFKMETDRTIICAYNFPAVVLTVGADYWDSHLRETYLSLTKDYQIKVRRTFAYSLHEIARIIGPERTESDLVQIFALYLMDLDDVKQGVLEHLAEFLGTLAISSRNEYIPILTEVWDGVMTNWRLRNILAAQLRDIALLFDAARVVEHVLPLAIRACNDEFAAVRETGVEAFPIILDIVKRAVDDEGESLSHNGAEDEDEEDEDDARENKRNFALALLHHIMERLDEFVRSNMYRGRLVFTQICRSLLEAGISAGDFASFFLSRLALLAVDEVVNVRIGTARTIRQVYLNEGYRQELGHIVTSDDMGNDNETSSTQSNILLDQMIYRLALDRDQDVRLFVFDLVDPERLKQEEKALPAEQHDLQHDQGDSEQQHQQQQQQQQQQPRAPMQDIEDSSFDTTTHHPSIPSKSTETLSNGLTIMQKIGSDDEQQTNSNHCNRPETETTIQEHEQQYQQYQEKQHEHEQHYQHHQHNQHQHQHQHQYQQQQQSHQTIRTMDGNDADDRTEKDDDINTIHTDSNGSNNDLSDTTMDYTEETHDHDKKSNHDEDGDELMTDVERDDDDDDEPAMIDDEDESTFADEKEKGEYVYLSKSSSGKAILAGSPSLSGGNNTT